MDYATIQSLPPEAYLTPERFRSDWDALASNVAARDARYRDGLKTSREAATVHISVRGVWGATLLNGGNLSSCEGIGYHANTEAFLQGILDGPAPVVVYRSTPGGITRTEIKPRT